MTRIPEYKQGEKPVLPRTTKERKRAFEIQRGDSFKQY